MTDAEKTGIRTRALERYMRAVDDRRAHCGRLSELIGQLRDVVSLHDDQTIHIAGEPGAEVFGYDEATGFTLPSHEDVIAAFVACQKARQTENRLLVDARNAGVDRTALDALSA